VANSVFGVDVTMHIAMVKVYIKTPLTLHKLKPFALLMLPSLGISNIRMGRAVQQHHSKSDSRGASNPPGHLHSDGQ
jgi:hypothetical protein